MNKQDYINLVTSKPWTKVEEVFKDTPIKHIPLAKALDINPEDWIKFSVDYIDLAKQQWQDTKPHYTGASNELARTLMELG